eukprot:11264238-Prorocentrum_lima.AAC.1
MPTAALVDCLGTVQVKYAGVHTRVRESAQAKFLEFKTPWADFIQANADSVAEPYLLGTGPRILAD